MALFLENGMLPTHEVVEQAKSKFGFLKQLDPTSVIFDNLESL
jgi:hypothetical protein